MQCNTNNGGCASLTVCTNTPGSRTCGTLTIPCQPHAILLVALVVATSVPALARLRAVDDFGWLFLLVGRSLPAGLQRFRSDHVHRHQRGGSLLFFQCVCVFLIVSAFDCFVNAVASCVPEYAHSFCAVFDQQRRLRPADVVHEHARLAHLR
jgi:hypothetical protein